MPLIDVTLKPGFTLTNAGGTVVHTRPFLRRKFGPELPGLFAQNCAAFGMEANTPEDGIQVQFHDYDADDINVADVWVKVQFSEEQLDYSKRIHIRDNVFDAIVKLFHLHGMQVPDNFILDVLWGPTHGCGSVNGTFIEW